MNNDIDLQTPDKAKIEEIIKIEWQMFQNVDNLGGRADCQDDFETFYIMRRSQYDNWTEEMVRVYGDFAAKSLKEGRNLISEKYARMMAYTDLHYFNKHLKDKLPAVPMINYRIISGIVESSYCGKKIWRSVTQSWQVRPPHQIFGGQIRIYFHGDLCQRRA